MSWNMIFESEVGHGTWDTYMRYEHAKILLKRGFPLGKSQTDEVLCSLLFEQRIGGLTLLKSKLWMVIGDDDR